MTPVERRILIKVATMYYLEHMKQTEIAKRLGVERTTVSKHLKRALEQGIVTITVANENFEDIESAPEKRFGLKECFIVPRRIPKFRRLIRISFRSTAAPKTSTANFTSTLSATNLPALSADVAITFMRPSSHARRKFATPLFKTPTTKKFPTSGRNRTLRLSVSARPSNRRISFGRANSVGRRLKVYRARARSAKFVRPSSTKTVTKSKTIFSAVFVKTFPRTKFLRAVDSCGKFFAAMQTRSSFTFAQSFGGTFRRTMLATFAHCVRKNFAAHGTSLDFLPLEGFADTFARTKSCSVSRRKFFAADFARPATRLHFSEQ